MNKKLPVAFLWHMHQPLYKDLRTGKYHLPWVRLHSTYSYLDMASAIEEFPEARGTFNFTPVLIWQLLDICGDKPIDDEYLTLTGKNASRLSDEERAFILKNFFSCDMAKAIAPIKHYYELFQRRGSNLRTEHLIKVSKEFSDQDMRDLQVFFNLAWCGFTLKRKDKLVKELIAKGKGFTEGEKHALLKRQHEVVRSILPTYKRLQDEGRIEISTTPFYHPILPLLCESGNGEGYDFKEDAKVHVKRAVELYEKVFGRKPVGMWPAEGSVSQDIIPILADEGVKWIATDEGILLESLKGEDSSREDLIYKAFTAREDGRKIDMVFRDINISNALSFRYSSMPHKKAVSAMMHDISGIAKHASKNDDDSLVAIILDGENPWPYYDDGGRKFLEETYRSLRESKDAETVTIGAFLEENKKRGNIEKLYSGSWINRNFAKWIGSPQKNKAWEYLQKAREELFASDVITPEALEELYIAEGSDWFWWYDEFGTELNFVFDDLFRLHLSNLYDLMGRKPPHYLSEPIPAGPSAQKLTLTSGPGEMAAVPKILLVSSEVVPYAKTGGLADVAGSLPRELASMGCDVRVIMPLYKNVTDADFELVKEASNIKHPFTVRVKGFDVYSARSGGVTTYFIRNKKLFGRSGLYGSIRGDYPDNGQRFAFFSLAALEASKVLGFQADVIHCNDWQSALVPFYLKFKLFGDPFYIRTKTLFTIHNMAYQGVFPKKTMKKVDIPESFFNMSDLEFYGKLNYMKSGILYSDAVSTVSHKYAEEIMTPEYGCGLDGLLRMKKDVLYGIPNGVDYSVWSPKNDKFIISNYGPDSLDKKNECKKDLLEYASLSLDVGAPLFGAVTRFAQQKGIDLIAGILPSIIEMGGGLVILGRGEEKYDHMFKMLADKYKGKVFYCSDFNDPLAHKIEAASDIFLMPSRYEPCGLNQMYSIKYGTIPVVRATGGLDDVITDYDEDRASGNGFKFGQATEEAFLEAVERAVGLYRDPEKWKDLMKRAMAYDFSWRSSAEQYLELYRRLMG